MQESKNRQRKQESAEKEKKRRRIEGRKVQQAREETEGWDSFLYPVQSSRRLHPKGLSCPFANKLVCALFICFDCSLPSPIVRLAEQAARAYWFYTNKQTKHSSECREGREVRGRSTREKRNECMTTQWNTVSIGYILLVRALPCVCFVENHA